MIMQFLLCISNSYFSVRLSSFSHKQDQIIQSLKSEIKLKYFYLTFFSNSQCNSGHFSSMKVPEINAGLPSLSLGHLTP